MDETLRIAVFGLGVPAVLGLVGAFVCSRTSGAVLGVASGERAARAVGVSLGLVLIAAAVVFGLVGVHGAWRPGSANMDARLQTAGLFLIAISMVRPLFAMLLGPEQAAGVSRDRDILRSVAPYAVICAAIAVGAGLWSGSAGTLASYTKVLGGTGMLVAALTLLASAAWALAVAGPLARVQLQSRPIVGGVLLTGMALATGAALLGTGSVSLGQYGFAVAAVSGGLLVASLLLRGKATGEQPLPIIVAALCTLMVCGVVFSETPLWVFGVLGIAPLAGMLAERSLARRARPLVSTLVLVGTTALVALIAVGPGILELVKFMTGSGGDDPYADY